MRNRQGRPATSECRRCGEEEVKLWPCLTPAPEGVGSQRQALAALPQRKKRRVIYHYMPSWVRCSADVDWAGEERVPSANRGSNPKLFIP